MSNFNQLSDNQFLQELNEVAYQARSNIEAFSGVFDVSKNAIKIRRERILRGKLITSDDIEFFGRTYFPHYIRVDKSSDEVPLSAFQTKLLINFARILNDEEACSDCLIAPRGEAKSTWCFILSLFCVITGRKKYLLYITDAFHQAAPVIESMKAELEVNRRLKTDFPKSFGPGPIWRAGEFITKTGIKVQAFGANTKMRGLRNGAYRPDLAILDDIENDDNVRNPRFRDDLEHWLNATVMGLGEAGEKFDVLYPGTILHPDSVLVRTMNNPMWQTTICKSIITHPTHIDLWEAWEEIYRDDGKFAAREFYNQNRQQLLHGSVVSWPGKRSLLYLMELKLKIGLGAFLAEQQGEPQPKDAVFTNFHYWAARKKWTYFGALDPSLGKSGKGRDPSAILIGGVCLDNIVNNQFTLEVVEASIKKRVPSKIIDDVLNFQKQYDCKKWAVEVVQFQEFLRTELIKKAHNIGIPLNALPVNQSTNKIMRIESLESPIAEGIIQFHSSQTILLEQLRQFPEHSHDDGPDCLEMLYNIAVRRGDTKFRGKNNIRRSLFNNIFGTTKLNF